MNGPFALGRNPFAPDRFQKNKEQTPAVQCRNRQQVGDANGDADHGHQLHYGKEPAGIHSLLHGVGCHAGDANDACRAGLFDRDKTPDDLNGNDGYQGNGAARLYCSPHDSLAQGVSRWLNAHHPLADDSHAHCSFPLRRLRTRHHARLENLSLALHF